MIISKEGYDHYLYDLGQQDYAIEYLLKDDEYPDARVSVLCDGCSSTKYPAIGAHLFCNNLVMHTKYESFMSDLIYCFSTIPIALLDDINYIVVGEPDKEHTLKFKPKYIKLLQDYLNFTILVKVEVPHRPNETYILTAGDGFIITRNNYGLLSIDDINPDLEYPPYLFYWFLDKPRSKYEPFNIDNNVVLKHKTVHARYDHIMLLSDGYTYIRDNKKLYAEFYRMVFDSPDWTDPKFKLKLQFFLNRHRQELKDDITICV